MDSLKTFGDMISRYAKKSLFSFKSCYTEAVVQRTYLARNDEELTLYHGDVIRNIVRKHGSWWKGELRGKCGSFHEKYVMFLPQAKEKVQINGSRKSNKGRTKQYAKVLFNYIPINEDEFKLEVGDIIEVCDEVEDGWWSGILGDQYGVFPSNYVALLEDKECSSDENDNSDCFSNEKANATSPKNAQGRLTINVTKEGEENNKSFNEEIFDAVKRSSPKLTHLTIARAKGPKRKPPSKDEVSSAVKKAIAIFEVSSPAKLNVTEENSFAECEKNIKKYGSLGNINSSKHIQQSKPKVIVQPNVFIELKQKLRELENEIDDLKGELVQLQKIYVSKTEHQKLKIEVDSMREMIVTHRQYCSKLMSDLMCEVDEEKKLRSVVQIQLDRIMKLLTCTCSKSVMPDVMPTDNSWKDTSV